MANNTPRHPTAAQLAHAEKDGHTPADPPRLALRPKDAAKALGIGERLLWSKTNAGEIPPLRIGNALIYPVAALENWLAEQAQKERGNR